MAAPSPTSLSPSVVAAEQRAREFLAQAKWRKARDEIKPLVKTDRERYLPLLIQANLGLAREMMSKGQVSEAQQVLSYLTTIAPASQLRAVELELAGKSGPTEASLPKFVAALAAPDAQISDAERVRLADLVVLGFQPVPSSDPGHARLAAEVGAVHDALLAVSQAQWERVSEILRAIPHRSVLSHWAVFLKGIAAFYTGDTDKADRCLRDLPPESVPAKAGQAYRLLANRLAPSPETKTWPGAVLEAACRLAGQSGAGPVLLRADQLWKEGRHADSYRALRDAVGPFPSHGLDWLSAVSEFYFCAPPTLSAAARSQYLHYFDGLLHRRATKNGAEEMLVLRMFALANTHPADAWSLRADWEGFLQQYERRYGHNPRLASLAYGWLGEQLSLVRPTFGFSSRPGQLLDPPGAIAALQKSIELDPNNLAAHLQLCAVHDALKNRSERNRLLDVMTARFPNDKPVLLRAAAGCLDRKAFVKGLDYLERARQLDPLDPQIPELTVTTRRRLARQQFQQHRPDKARQTLAQAADLLTDRPEDLQRSRWTALVRHGLMEQLWGDAAQADALLAQARALAPRPDACLLFAHLAHRVYANVRRCESPFLKELKRALYTAPNVSAIGRLLRILDYWKKAPEAPPVSDEDMLVYDAFKTALRQPFTRAEALEVIERLQGNYIFEDRATALVKKILRDDPLDPQFRLFQLTFSGDWEFNPRGSRSQLQSIVEEAVRRHDEAAMRQATQMLRDLDHPMPPPESAGPFFDGEDEDEDFDEDFGPESGLPPDLPPKQLAQFAELIELLRGAPPSAVRKLRPPGMPKFIFDTLLQIAQGAPSPLPPPPPLPRQPLPRPLPPKPAAPPADPNQMNLF